MKPETLSTTHRENIINGVQSYSSYSWLQTIHPPTTNNNKGTSPSLLCYVQKHTVNPRPAQQKQYRCNTTDGLQGSTTPTLSRPSPHQHVMVLLFTFPSLPMPYSTDSPSVIVYLGSFFRFHPHIEDNELPTRIVSCNVQAAAQRLRGSHSGSLTTGRTTSRADGVRELN